MFREVAEDFMRRVFDFAPGSYLISDESSLFDFTGVDEMELKDIQRKIQEVYDVDVSDLVSGNLGLVKKLWPALVRRLMGQAYDQDGDASYSSIEDRSHDGLC